MSASMRWRCDVCRNEAASVEEIPRGMLAFFSPKQPPEWHVRMDGTKRLDLCSQACVVAHQHAVLGREQAKLNQGLVPSPNPYRNPS